MNKSYRRRTGWVAYAAPFAAAFAVGASLVAAGCGGGGGATASAGGSSSGTYVIGAPLALTGDLAPYDTPALNGMKLAVDEVNAAGGVDGHKLSIVARDTRTKTAQNAVLAQELIAGGAKMLATSCDDDPSIAAGRIAEQDKILAISTCAANPALPAAVGPFMFTNWPSESLEGQMGAQYAFKRGFRRAFVMYSNDAIFLSRLPLAWAKEFQALGGKVVGTATYRVGDTNFSSQVSQIQSLKPDIVETAANEPEFPAFMRALRGAGVTTQVMEADGIDTDTITKYGDVLNGVIFTTGDFPTPGSLLAKFNAAYQEKFGSKPSIYAAYGYALVKPILVTALQKAGTTDPVRVRDALNSLANLSTVVGPVTYAGQHGLAKRSVVVLDLVNTKRKLLAQLGG